MCARFLSHLSLLYIGRVHGAISGCTVLWEVYPASAQNDSYTPHFILGSNISLSETHTFNHNMIECVCLT